MNPILAIGQIIVSIALMAAILLQARGTGLSGTFGGDSAVYRSRRGVERRLWQFTVVLLVLFVLFSLAAFIFAPTRPPPDGARRGGPPRRIQRSELHDPDRHRRRRDPRRAARGPRGPHRRPGAPDLASAPRHARVDRAPARPVRRRARTVEGVLGRPVSVGPLTARTQADRDLVALVFSGLVRNGPDGTLVPDLAERWTVDATGKTWTFTLRADARWHDGEPVTADDVVFTIETLQDPDVHGPGADVVERGHGRDRPAPTGHVHARRPRSAGSSRPRPSRSRRPTSSATCRSISSPTTRSAASPIGSGPFAADRADDDLGLARPGRDRAAEPRPRATAGPAPLSTDSLATPRPDRAARRGRCRTSPASSSASSTMPRRSPRAYRAGELDAASGLPPAVAADSARRDGQPARSATRDRPSRPSCSTCARRTRSSRRPAVRTALLAGASTGAPIIHEAFADGAGVGHRRRSRRRRRCSTRPPIRQSSTISRRRRGGAEGGRLDEGADGWRRRARRSRSRSRSSARTEASNPGLFAAAEAVVRDWTAIGLSRQARRPAARRVRGEPAGDRATSTVAVADMTHRPRPRPLPAARLEPDADRRLERRSASRTGARRAARAARAPGSARPDARPPTARSRSSSRRADTCSRWPSRTRSSCSATRSRDPSVRQVTDAADRFWDVLTWRLADGR